MLLNYVVLKDLWKIDLYLICTLVNKSLYHLLLLLLHHCQCHHRHHQHQHQHQHQLIVSITIIFTLITNIRISLGIVRQLCTYMFFFSIKECSKIYIYKYFVLQKMELFLNSLYIEQRTDTICELQYADTINRTVSNYTLQ